jgi:hypothetical protein
MKGKMWPQVAVSSQPGLVRQAQERRKGADQIPSQAT